MTVPTEERINQSTESNSDTPAQSGGRLQFPAKFDAEDGNWLTFTRYKYSRPSRTEEPIARLGGKVVALPPPSALRVSYGAEWSDMELGLFGRYVKGALGDVVKNVSKKGASSYIDQKLAGMSSVPTTLDTLKTGAMDIFKNLPGAAGAYWQDVILNNQAVQNSGAYSGIARNPFTAFIYNGPQFRTFNFEYDLVPKNRQEADTIRDIIREFKLGLSPSFETSYEENIFEYPDVFGIRFVEDSHLFKMMPCALKDLSVDYHGQGSPIYFEGKIPFSIKVGMVFQELRILTREDFEANNF